MACYRPVLHCFWSQVRGQHFQVACGKYFEAKHKGSTLIETELGGISHPNEYFEHSMKVLSDASPCQWACCAHSTYTYA